MDQSQLGTKDIIGMFYLALEAASTQAWANKIGMYFESNQETEKYKWLGMSPMMREWVGGRQAKTLAQNGINITNKEYEATLEFFRKDLKRDKTGQIQVRINDLARRANQHWNKLVSTLIEAGETTICYDGQYFFDTDHSEGSSGTQKNSLVAGDYAALNVGTATAPTAAEMADVILAMIQHAYSLKDDQGEPINEDARSFLVMVPVPFWGAAKKAISLNNLNVGTGVQENVLKVGNGDDDIKLSLAPNPRLTWTTKLALFRTDGSASPFILQEEEKIKIEAVGEGPELEFNENVHRYGVRASRNVGYGFWQQAILATLS